MPKPKDAVRCRDIKYPIEAWQTIYEYITRDRAPDCEFNRQMKRLGVSRSDAYTLYRAQLYTPWEVSFIKGPPEEGGRDELTFMYKGDEKIAVSKHRKK